MHVLLKSALFASAFALPTLARADSFTITLTPFAQTAAPGSTMTYSGTVIAAPTNTAADYINEGAITFSGPSDISSDGSDSLALNNGDAFNAGTTASGDLFTLTIPSTEAFGNYSGTLVLLGGPDFSTLNQLGQVNFNLTVGSAPTPISVTPEPSSDLLLASGLVGVYALVRRQRTVSA